MKTRKSLLAAAMILLICLTASGQQKRPMTLRDVMDIKQVGSPMISPDGKHVVYTLNYPDMQTNETNTEIWFVSSEGTDARRFTSGKNDRSPKWSPNGRWIAFISNREKTNLERANRNQLQDRPQIYLIAPDGGEAMKLTSSKSGIGSFAWSQDSTRIAYISQIPLTVERERQIRNRNDAKLIDEDFTYSSLHVIDLKSKTSKEVVRGDFVVSQLAWSPDSTKIAYSTRPTPKADDRSVSDIYVANADGSSVPYRLYENDGPDSNPIWSPDGHTILFNSRSSSQGAVGFSRLHSIPASGGKASSLIPDFDAPTSNIHFSSDGKTIFFQSGQRTTRQIFSVSAKGGNVEQITDYQAVVTGFSISADGKKFAFTRTDVQNPNELYVASLPSFDPVKVSSHNPQLSDIAMGKSQIISWKSKDGREIEGLVIYPVGYDSNKTYPVLMNVHGGPSGAWTQSFPGRWGNYGHVWAGKDWVTLLPNPRGSSGYGEEFQLANLKDWGGGDYEDVQSGLDELIRLGVADKDRMGQTGWSYGGYMTAWTLTQTNRFKAVMVGAGLTNMFSMYSTNDLQKVLEGYFGDTAFNNVDEYRKASAMTFIKQANTPTLIMHVEQDQRVPKSQAQELYIGLKKNDVPVQMVWYPREPHGLREPRHQLDKMRREFAFFSKHVLKTELEIAKTDHEQILSVIQKVFDHLKEGNGEAMKDLFWPGAMMVADRKEKKGRNQHFMLAEEWANNLSNETEPVIEEMINPIVQTDKNIASVWTRYTLKRAEYIAEGVDAFHLVKKDGIWRIISVVYTHNPKE